MGKNNGALPFEVLAEAIIEIKLGGAYDGLYRVTSVGSAKDPWVLEKLN